MESIYNYSLEDFKNYFILKNERPYRSEQIMISLYRSKIKQFDEITTIKKEFQVELSNDFIIDGLKLSKKQVSKDGTIKFLFELKDGNLIETVLMNHPYGKSLCVTSQVGCNMGCKFCASGLIKKKRNLEPSEMVLQILEVEKLINVKITHVVVMGIGEPFDNYHNVLKFIEIINYSKGLAIGSRHISVSTSGLVNKIKEFAIAPYQTNLAISFHAPFDEIREKIMPINKKYNIEVLLNAIDYYILKTNRRVTIEYILIDGLNDTIKCANKLIEIFKNRLVYINLIPYNEVLENGFKRSKKENMDLFYKQIKKANLNVTLRHEQGHDIDAACGQLRNKSIKNI